MESSISREPIESTVELNKNFHSVSDRYFSHYYFTPKIKHPKVSNGKETLIERKAVEAQHLSEDNVSTVNNDTCIMMHSNRICVITVSPKHPIIAEQKDIVKIDFEVQGMNRLSNKVSGKGKRGAQVLGMYSPLCKLTCSDDSSYTILTGIRGKLVEVNERLLKNPNLITSFPQSDGYLAIVLPKQSEREYSLKCLVGSKEYVNKCDQ